MPDSRTNARHGAMLLTLQLLALHPVGCWYVLRMRDGSDEPWGVFALGSALLLLLAERARNIPVPDRRWLVIASLGMAGYVLSLYGAPPLVRAMIGVAALTATLIAVLQPQGPRLALVGLMLLSLPLVSSLQFYLGYPLRVFTAWASTVLLGLIGLDLQRQGTALLWQGHTILVDAPCSGVRMLWVGLVLTCILCYRLQVSERQVLRYLCTGTAIVVLANSLRASALFLREIASHPLPAWTHEGIGVLAFVTAVTLIVLCVKGPRHAQ